MIDAKELKLNNWILAEVGLAGLQYHKFSCGDFGDLGTGKLTEDMLYPIPLTEDILLKCGFEKIKLPKGGTYYGHSEYNFGNVVFKVDNQNTLNSNGSNKYFFLNKFRIKCEYLHTLQNLVFALTQKELTVQL